MLKKLKTIFLRDRCIKIAVHSGNFHPDDVFSVALLSIMYEGNIKVVRSRSHEIYSKADFIVDVGLEYDPGKNKFDHHQEGGAGERPNGIKYSSIGLLWKSFGEKVCSSKKVADIIDSKLVQIIDADDTGFNLSILILEGVYPFTIADVIYSFRSTWKESERIDDKAFIEAVDVAKNVLERQIRNTRDEVDAEELIGEVYGKAEDKRIIFFENNLLPKGLLLKYPEPLFTIYKERGGNIWRVTAVRKSERGFEVRKKFPDSWSGKDSEELIAITGVKDASFCHTSCVFAGAKSKEGAIELAKKAITNSRLQVSS